MIQRPADILGNQLPLEGLRVCLSGAVPERQYWGDVPDLDRLILTFVAQFSALVIRYGGQVIHGSQPALTPVVAEQARRQVRKESVPLRLFASQLFGQLPEVTLNAARVARANVILTGKMGDGDANDLDTRNQSLTAMRLVMMQEVDVVVAIGGKLHIDTGFSPGVFEELAQAHWHSVPCFVIGAFSGAAAKLEHPVLEELSAGNRFEDQSPLVEMATWTDRTDEYVGKLLGHLAQHAAEFRKRKPVSHRAGAFRLSEVAAPTVGTVSVIQVDADLTRTWQARFAELRRHIEQKDTDGARKLLGSRPF
jgi:hypothetical protein